MEDISYYIHWGIRGIKNTAWSYHIGQTPYINIEQKIHDAIETKLINEVIAPMDNILHPKQLF